MSCFIDDHVDVLRGMPKVETKILFGHRTVPDLNGKAEEGGIVAAPTWEKAFPLVLLEQKANSTVATGVRSTSEKSSSSEAHGRRHDAFCDGDSGIGQGSSGYAC